MRRRSGAWVSVLIVVMSAFATWSSRAVASPVYFLVSEFPDQREHGDSFVLPLEDTDDISHARDLVTRGRAAGRTQVTADIVAGSDQINRNILVDGKPAWSWHISRFDGFHDVGIELTDGWPSFIEQDVQGWINNTGGGTVDNDGDGQPDGNATIGRIAFWSYTVTAELTGPPTDLSIIPRTAIPLPGALTAGAGMLALALAGVRKMM
jgi:hypothetical protein